MKKVLYVKCNMKDSNSSRTIAISDEFIKNFSEKHPDAEVEELDLFSCELPGLDKDIFNAWGMLQQGKGFDELSDIQKHKLARVGELTEQFMSADVYVFSFPMWNLSCPAEMKKYIDNITIVGKTFRYTEKGPIGLLNDKPRKAILVSTYGGFHFGNSEDFCTPYVESLLKFLGITDVQSIVADGLDAVPAKTADTVESAKVKARELAVSF
ncbi:MAG: FMN-dependent NADH-azoreductase [Deferribacterales bacterium]